LPRAADGGGRHHARTRLASTLSCVLAVAQACQPRGLTQPGSTAAGQPVPATLSEARAGLAGASVGDTAYFARVDAPAQPSDVVKVFLLESVHAVSR
jgi:hypothetical protein